MLPREFLYIADELFFCGTAAEITPIRSVDRIEVGAGRPGPVTQRIQREYLGIVHGQIPDRHGWLTHVPEPVAAADRGALPRVRRVPAAAPAVVRGRGAGCTGGERGRRGVRGGGRWPGRAAVADRVGGTRPGWRGARGAVDRDRRAGRAEAGRAVRGPAGADAGTARDPGTEPAGRGARGTGPADAGTAADPGVDR